MEPVTATAAITLLKNTGLRLLAGQRTLITDLPRECPSAKARTAVGTSLSGKLWLTIGFTVPDSMSSFRTTKSSYFTVETNGRHDPCVGIRATPIAEAMMALVLMDHALLHRAQNADVTTKTPKISGSLKKRVASGTQKPTAKINPDPDEA